MLQDTATTNQTASLSKAKACCRGGLTCLDCRKLGPTPPHLHSLEGTTPPSASRRKVDQEGGPADAGGGSPASSVAPALQTAAVSHRIRLPRGRQMLGRSLLSPCTLHARCGGGGVRGRERTMWQDVERRAIASRTLLLFAYGGSYLQPVAH